MNVIKVLKLIDSSTISLIIKLHKDGQSMDTADPSSHNLLKKAHHFSTMSSDINLYCRC